MKIYSNNAVQQQIEQIYSNSSYRVPDTYVEYKSLNMINKHFIKPIAFYLPQYYATPINNQNWGRGFTEWTNVAKAVPQYLGHYQPHIPEAFGYYTLNNDEIMKKQCDLARQYGIFGFCFYYYYFNGGTQLERPLKIFTNSKNIDFPFCLCWANENWTRRWDGKNEEVLLKQTYEKDTMIDFIKRISQYFKLHNYIRVNDKPMLIVYNVLEIPDIDFCINIWREYCRCNGVGEIYLVCAKTMGLENPDIINKFDACVEFPPHNIHLKNQINYSLLTNKRFEGYIYHIEDYISCMEHKFPYTLYRCAFPSWDNTARVGEKAKIFSDANPETFKKWLQKIITITTSHLPKTSRFVFVNAWNEWGEGAHLEPDRKYGYAYLDVLRKCIEEL